MGPTPRSRRYAFFPKTSEPVESSPPDSPEGKVRERVATLTGDPWSAPACGDAESTELLTVGQAATLFGRSERTLRRWIASGLLRDARPSGDRGGPRIFAGELRARIAAAEEAPSPGSPDRALIHALEARITDLRDQVADLRDERSRLRAERHELLEQLRRERESRVIAPHDLAVRPSFWDRILRRV